METKAIRIFYRKSDNQIVWTHELKGTGEFPNTVKSNLSEIPDKVASAELDEHGDIINEVKVGGVPGDYACIEETDAQGAIGFLDSDGNKIEYGKLVVGVKRIEPEPLPVEPPRDLAKEIDRINSKLDDIIASLQNDI